MSLPTGQMSDSGATIGVPKTVIKADNDARARVSSQDTSQIHALFVQRILSRDMYYLMLSQLGNACGVHDSAFAQLTQQGVGLMQLYSTLNFTQQLTWIRADLRLREAMYAQDHRDIRSRHSRNGMAYDDSFHAVSKRMQINSGQINHLKLVKTDLAAMLQAQPPTTRMQPSPRTDGPLVSKSDINVPKSTVALRAEAPQSQIAIPASGQPLTHCAPLQSLPTNRSVKLQPQLLKRKRTRQQSVADGKISPVIEDSSEDEDELLGQLEALQSKIAAIQARTSREDELASIKKPKKNPRTAACAITQPEISIPSQDLDPAQTSATPFFSDDSFKPPRSSQDVRSVRSKVVEIPSPVTLPELRFSAPFGPRRFLHHDPALTAQVRRATIPAVKYEVEVDASRSPALTKSHSTARPVVPCDVVDLTSSPSGPQSVPAIPPSSEPVLCAEQQQVVDLILAGKNVFYTGSAGCGKSTVLKSFVPKLRDQGKMVRIVAPTGKAALDINGSTTWTYAGWTPSHFKQPLEDLVKAAHGKFVRRRFNETDVLVIDEISMVENHLLQRLDAVMKEARGSIAAFGGVQLVVTGDFCQLPPVKPFQFCMHCGKGQTQRFSAGKTVYRCPRHGDSRDEDKWAFRSQVWQDCKFQHINLSQIHRQKDEVFIKILQKLRVGTALSNEDRQLLLNHPCDVANAVKLFPRRLEVKRINDTEFNRLNTQKHSYTCLDHFSWNEVHGNLKSKGFRNNIDDSLEALREHRLENHVEYKIGMLVVLLVNLDVAAGLVNGSQGRIIGFEPYDSAKLPKATVFEGGGGGGRGATSQRKPVSGHSKSGRFALTQRRGRDSSLEVESIVMGELRGEHAVLRESQIRHFLQRPCNTSKQWPMVEFDNGIIRTIFADCQVNELGDEKPYTLLARTQIPLIAAWAMTIHKSQGMTLNKVIVDLGNSFEEGQEYVALSRARSLDGLKVVSLGAGVGKGGNPQVREFLWQRFKIR